MTALGGGADVWQERYGIDVTSTTYTLAFADVLVRIAFLKDRTSQRGGSRREISVIELSLDVYDVVEVILLYYCYNYYNYHTTACKVSFVWVSF